MVINRGVDLQSLPLLVVVPGIMGSHLELLPQHNRIWLDPTDIIRGGLKKPKTLATHRF